MSGLEDFMLPCLWKKYLYIDCLGCGFQRSLILLLKGDFSAAFYMYPAVYGIVLMMGFLVLHLKFKFKYGPKILVALFSLNAIIILINYTLKFI